MINRYTVGAGIVLILVLLALLWLQFGAMFSSWTGGVYRAVKGQTAAIEELKKAEQAAQQAIVEKEAAQDGIRALAAKFKDLQLQIDTKTALLNQQRQLAAQLQDRLAQLESQRVAQPRVTGVHDAYSAIQSFGPPYSVRR